jgi:hypothetical protein
MHYPKYSTRQRMRYAMYGLSESTASSSAFPWHRDRFEPLRGRASRGFVHSWPPCFAVRSRTRVKPAPLAAATGRASRVRTIGAPVLLWHRCVNIRRDLAR